MTHEHTNIDTLQRVVRSGHQDLIGTARARGEGCTRLTSFVNEFETVFRKVEHVHVSQTVSCNEPITMATKSHFGELEVLSL